MAFARHVKKDTEKDSTTTRKEGVTSGLTPRYDTKVPEEVASRLEQRRKQGETLSRTHRADTIFDDLWVALMLAHERYMKVPDRHNAVAYQALAGELRTLMADLAKTQNKEDILRQIVAVGLNPFLEEIAQALLTESDTLQTELVRSGVTESSAKRIAGSFVLRIGSHMKRNRNICKDAISEVLTASENAAKKGKSLNEGATANVTPLRAIAGGKTD